MNLQLALVLLIGIISALNANLYEESESEYGETDYNDYYEKYNERNIKFEGMSNIFFFDIIMLIRSYNLSKYS